MPLLWYNAIVYSGETGKAGRAISMRKTVFKRITALFLCLLLLVGFMPVLPAKTAVVGGDMPLHIPAGKYEPALNVYYGGAIADFTLGDGRLISVADTFTGKATIPLSLLGGRGTNTPYIYLLPYARNTPEGFVEAYIETFRDYTSGGLFYARSQKRTVKESSDILELEAEELVAEGDIASGLYVPYVIFYDRDPIKNRDAEIDVTLFSGAFPICVSNPADGGFKGDPSEYISEKKTLLDVSVKLEGRYSAYKNVRVTIYSEDRSICYGVSPCYVTGGRVLLDIVPGAGSSPYTDEYDFPSLAKGSPRVIDVPQDGAAEVTVYRYGLKAEISGHVYDSNGEAAAGAVVSYSTAEGSSGSKRADSEGYYYFDEIYTNHDVNIFASKGRESYSGTVETASVKDGRATCDCTLKAAKPAFTLKLSGSSDEVLSEIISIVLGTGLTVTDDKKAPVDGDLLLDKGNMLAFFPYRDTKAGESFRIIPDERYFTEAEVTVEEGRTAELKVKGLAIVKGVITAEDYPGYPHVYFFDGNELVYGISGLTRDVYQIIDVPEEGKQYHVITIVSADREPMSLDREALVERVPGAAEQDITLENGKTVDLGNVETAFKRNYDLSGLSYISAFPKTENGENIIKIKGHIESDGNLKITAIRAYGYTHGSSNSYTRLTAGFKENSLVINGHARSEKLATDVTYFTDVGRLIKLDPPIPGPADFSLTLSRFFDGDVIVRISADGTLNGEAFEDYTVGECMINGQPVTISVRNETVDGYISASGTAAPGETVYVLDGDTVIGSTQANSTGTWQLGVNLLTVPGRRSIHKIRAKSQGFFSDDATVVYDPEGSAVGEIYMTQDGKELPKTYVWTSYASFAFNAVVAGDEITDPSFVVLCSDGSTMRLSAHISGYIDSRGATKTLYSTDEVKFGEMNKCPIKVWFETTKERKPLKLDSAVSINAGKKPTEEQLNKLDNTFGAEEVDGNTAGETPVPAGTVKSVISVTSRTSNYNEFEKLKSKGAAFVTICDDYGSILYETCSILDGLTYYLCVHDLYGDKYTITINEYDVYSADSSTASLEGSQILPESEIRLFGSGDYELGKSYAISQVGGKVRDEALDSLNPLVKSLLLRSPATAPFAKVVDVIGVGDLYTIYETGAYGVDYNRKSKNADEELAMLKFFSRAAREIDDKVDTQRLQNSVGNAMGDLNTANEMQSDALGQSIALAVANWGLKKFGPEYELIVGMTETISGPMMDEVKSHSDQAWAYAMQSATEAKREFQLLTGMTKDQMLQLYRDYEAGKITGYDIRKRIEESMKNKKPADKENSEEFEPIIDPSGYVFEAVASNRIEGATVTLIGADGQYFDAGNYGQENPLTSDRDGRYSWDVPEGNWFVQVYKPGYESGDSGNDPAATVTINGKNYLPVLPPQLDVNIALTSPLRPIGSLSYEGGGWYPVFDKYVQADTVTVENISFSADGFNGNYNFEPMDAEISPPHTPVCGGQILARRFRLTGDAGELSAESRITASVSDSVLGYNGKAAGSMLTANGGAKQGADPGQKPTEKPSQEPTGKPGKTERDPENDDAFNWLPVILIVAGVGSVLVIAAVAAAVIITKKRKNSQGK
jgi:hypothetical protein